jgi:CheY-like chemotaxis protein
MKPAETVFELAPLLKQIGTDFLPTAREKKLELVILPSSLHVRTDRNLLRRLIQNLVSNAIKYTREGKVLVGVRRRGEFAEIQVADSGIGIPADELNTVFREFTRLDGGKREAPGLGLGLSIVDRIARVLRIEIRALSFEGRGTRFSVLLPVTAARPAPALNPANDAGAAGQGLAGLRVICLDNDARILDGMRTLLGGWGCIVDTISDPDQLNGRERPDVLLADYHLDRGTGLDAIASARRLYDDALFAVLITADRSTEVRAEAERLDVTVINKPLKPAALRSVMARARRMTEAAE